MKHISKKFFAALSVCLAAGMLVAPLEAGAIEVTVVNELDEKVLLAMGKWVEGRSSSRGWWSVEPGATRTIRPFEGSEGEYFFRAVTESGERMWHGSDEYDSSFFWLHSTKAFDCPPGKTVRGGKKGRFHFFPQIYWKNREDPKDGFILTFRKDTWDLGGPDPDDPSLDDPDLEDPE